MTSSVSAAALSLAVSVAGAAVSLVSSSNADYKICQTFNCQQPQKQCQTRATAQCECDSWKARAPAEWGMTQEAGSCCMRPVYNSRRGPWCYCKGTDSYASCGPELHPSKGIVDLQTDRMSDEWTEAAREESVLQLAEGSGEESSTSSATVDCVDGAASTSRENQLGNARDTANPDAAIPHGLNANRYIWTVSCAFLCVWATQHWLTDRCLITFKKIVCSVCATTSPRRTTLRGLMTGHLSRLQHKTPRRRMVPTLVQMGDLPAVLLCRTLTVSPITLIVC